MKRFSPSNRGFTLIEMLVVLAIILILAGLIINTFSYVMKKAARSRAEGEMAAITTALENYKIDYGDYPIMSNGSPNVPGTSPVTNTILLTNLMPTTGKVYMEFNNATVTNNKIMDPFGEPYGYIYTSNGTGLKNTNSFDLWSRAGSTTNTNNWLKNW